MTEVEKKNNDTEIFVADLKNQLQEAKKVENSITQQLKKREKELEKYEAELVLLRKMINAESFQSKFVSSSKNLDDILSCRRSSSNKIGLGYDKGMKSKKSSPTIQDGNKRIMLMYSKTQFKREIVKNMILFKMKEDQ